MTFPMMLTAARFVEVDGGYAGAPVEQLADDGGTDAAGGSSDEDMTVREVVRVAGAVAGRTRSACGKWCW